jgi:hypothetical protein
MSVLLAAKRAMCYTNIRVIAACCTKWEYCLGTSQSNVSSERDECKKHTLKANPYKPRRAHAAPLPRRAALIHTCHVAPLPFSDSAVSFVEVRVIAGNIWTASPTV